MTNREWLNSLSNEELIVVWDNKCAVCTERDSCEKCDKCAYGLKSWLEAEYIPPLELCPFKCTGCSRRVEIKNVMEGHNCYSLEPSFYIKPVNMLPCCRLKGWLAKTKEEAIDAWNRNVRGE